MTKYLWNAEDYHEHSSAQKAAAIELLKQVPFKGHEQILDVGCGDGKITASLTKYVPKGSVLGVDNSREMIDFAQKTFPQDQDVNLAFSLKDARDLDYQAKMDVIFSSFALQWLADLSFFLKGAYKSLGLRGFRTIDRRDHSLERMGALF
jgi:trans-aconitate methyltransferase